MTSYPSLKRCLAAGLTLCLIGAVIVFVSSCDTGAKPAVPVALAAEGGKTAGDKVGGQDWNMYGGSPARNMVNTTVKGLPTRWVDDKDELIAKHILWTADLGSKAYGGPIVAGGRVFVGTNNQNPRDKNWIKQIPVLDEKLKPRLDKDGKVVTELGPVDLGIIMCFDEAKGDFNWQTVFEKLPGGLVVDWPREGICSSPHVEGDKMYFVSNSCKVVCADVKTGKSIWILDMRGELGVFPHNISDCSPLLVGDHLWVVTSNGVNEDHITIPAPKAPSFIKVDKKNGKVLWQDNSPTAALLDVNKAQLVNKNFLKELVNSGRLVQHGQWANPAYGVINGQPQVIFPGGDGWIRAVDLDGKLIWKFDCNPKDSKYELSAKGTRNDFIATPVIYKNRVYIGVGQDPEHETGVGHFWCIDMTKKGDVSPELVTNGMVFPPKTEPNKNSAKVWHYGGSIDDPKERVKLGRNYYFGRTMSTCAIHEDILYISELDGTLHCLDADTGKVHWTHRTGAQIWSSPYYADGKVYLGVDNGTVFVFQHGKTKKLLGENAMDAAVRATPVAANGILYVMTERKLYAIKQ